MIKSKFFSKLKSVDYRYYIVAVLTLILLSLSYLYKNSFIRLFEALRDLVFSLGFYFSKIFGINKDVPVTVLEASSVKLSGFDFAGFRIRLAKYFENFASPVVFRKYLKLVLNLFLIISSLGISVFFSFFALAYICKMFVFQKNNKYGRKSWFLNYYDKFRLKLIPLKIFVSDLYEFIVSKKILLKIWLFIAVLYLNLFSVVFSIVAWLFYVFVSFDFSGFFTVLYKLVLDLSLTFGALPGAVWFFIFVALFCYFRKKFAYARLNILEMRNRGFLESLPVVSLFCGTMGSKKTTLITDMAISQVSVFRYRAGETMFKIAMKYKHFDFQMFENWILKIIDSGFVRSLATLELALKDRQRYFDFCITDEFKANLYKGKKELLLWGYDLRINEAAFDDRLCIRTLFEDLASYAKAFFIYICDNFVCSNYSVRLDDIPFSAGNLIRWDDDFNCRKPKNQASESRFSKILDFDVLRLGKTVVENNPLKGSFEFGVVAVTEIGKERLNQLELTGVKKSEKESNQKNDYFNYWLKMCRHSSTVDYYPYLKVFADEQRPESLGADARDLAMICSIDKSFDKKLALPFFFLEDWICEAVTSKFKNFYLKYRFNRADESFLFRFLRFVAGKLFCYRLRMYNRFSYCPVGLSVQMGNSEKGDKAMYYLIDKKIYSNRFATDAFKDYFYKKSVKSGYGIVDYPEYETVVASMSELEQQNSHFINMIFGKGESENEKEN